MSETREETLARLTHEIAEVIRAYPWITDAEFVRSDQSIIDALDSSSVSVSDAATYRLYTEKDVREWHPESI